ncbi:MAG: nucleotidyltransferase domain-containing protein [Myxococcota bacterium]
MGIGLDLPAGTEPPEVTAAIRAEIERLTLALRSLGAIRVILFGSRARGDHVRGSDTDLLVVLPELAGESYPARVARVWAAIDPRIALDLLVYSPAEFEEMQHSRPFVRNAVAEGRVLHGSA